MKDFAPNCPLYVQILKPENKFHVKFAGVFGALWRHGRADCKGVKGWGEVKYSSHELKESSSWGEHAHQISASENEKLPGVALADDLASTWGRDHWE